MSSALPLDSPYTVLGVEKDADISAIRSRYRKLVLTYHPDRIPEDANRAERMDIFYKIQDAYEILSDPSQREHYDAKVKLAELRKEWRDLSFQKVAASHPFRPPPARRQSQDHRVYEERKPGGSYFEDIYRYWEDDRRRPSFRRDDVYEGRTFAGQEDRGAKNNGTEGVKDKSYVRGTYASRAKEKERDRQRDRSYKSTRKTYVEEDSTSDSDMSRPYVPSSTRREHDPRPSPPPRRKTEFTRNSSRPMPKVDPPPIKTSKPKQSESHDSRGRGFWGSDPGSALQNRQRASSVYSHTSSRNGSLRGHDSFDRGYQRPTYSRPRAGSAASGGSAGSRYDIDRTSPGLPPMPHNSRYWIVDDDYFDDKFEADYHPGNRPKRPTISPRYKGEAGRDKSRRASMPLIDTPVQPENTPSKDEVPRPEPFSDTAWVAGPYPIRQEPSFPQAKENRTVDCDVCGWEVKAERKRDWQKHLFEDLRPYICLEDGCPSSTETYSTTTKLLAHMKEQHSESEFLTAKKLTCPFCREELPQKRLQRIKHVGSNMEDIALASVTRAYEDWTFYSDSEKYLSSVGGMEQRGHDQQAESSKPIPDVPKTATLVEVATKADERSPKATIEAIKGKEQTRRKPLSKETQAVKGKKQIKRKPLSNDVQEAKTRVESTGPSEPVNKKPQKKDYPRVQRTSGISSWGDWKGTDSRHKADKTSTPSS